MTSTINLKSSTIKCMLLLLMLIGIFKISEAQVPYTFASQSGSYVPLSGGTVAPLSAAFISQKTLLDESFSNNVGIGFTFQYDGKNYTTISLNSNGFAALGGAFLASTTDDPNYGTNELRSGSGEKGILRPILAPFWDNLVLSNANDISYKMDGVAPSRTFTVQWQNMIWDSGSPAISFQLKLYETSNRIEFLYQPQAGAGGSNRSASIGLTADNFQKKLLEVDSLSFLSVYSGLGNGISSSKIEADTIKTKPSSNNVFRFTPISCIPPSGIQLTSFGNNTATITWTALQGATQYEYAISNIDVQPVSGTKGNVTTASFTGLVDNTEYYFYIKSVCGTHWRKYVFKTSVTASLPYEESFENTTDQSLPFNMVWQNNSNSFADAYWQTTDLLPAATGAKVVFNGSPFVNAKTWLFTPTFNLVNGQEYLLSFKVATTGGTSGLEVKYGKLGGEQSMINMLYDDAMISNTAFTTKEIKFKPTSTGEYIIGLGYKSAKSSELLSIDDITFNTTGDIVLDVNNDKFKAKLVSNRLVKLEWENITSINPEKFIIERSGEDNIFKPIGEMWSRSGSANAEKFEYFDRNPLDGANLYRIRSEDMNGVSKTSKIQVVYTKDYLITSLYPNPSSKEVFLKTSNTAGLSIKVYSLSGANIPITFSILGKTEIKIVPSTPLIAGVYMVSVISATETRVLKWLVN
ncbi:MAG: T9SS C-terminal target domain-containing protein [Sphingobacteriales bacterium]|nr:MAG: T9SS C-terminal target domain-containing protein [Sphingobacteriales bacterium]